MQTSTYFGLLAEFGSAEIPLEQLSEKYFGLTPAKAKNRACRNELPVPAYRLGSQKSGWLISASVLAEHIEKQRQAAAEEWRKLNQ